MTPRTILVRSLEVVTASKLGQLMRRTQTNGEEVRRRHQAACWFAPIFVLGFTGLACRDPAEAPHKSVVQMARPQVENSVKEAGIKFVPAEQVADQSVQTESPTSVDLNVGKDAVPGLKDNVAERDQARIEPMSAGVKVGTSFPPIQPTDAAKDSPALRPTAEHPTKQAALTQVAISAMDRGKPVSPGGKAAGALTATAKATQAPKGPEALHTSAKNPADQAVLAQVALRDKDWSVRKVAVEGLTNQGVLAQVAVSDEDLEIRKLAVSRLTAQGALAMVATSDKDWSVRKVATAMLTEQGILARIALADIDSDIRKLAVSLLTDQAALARVARSDKDWSVRRSAVNKLTSRSSLAQVATGDSDPDIRKLAVSRLIDQTDPPKSDQEN